MKGLSPDLTPRAVGEGLAPPAPPVTAPLMLVSGNGRTKCLTSATRNNASRRSAPTAKPPAKRSGKTRSPSASSTTRSRRRGARARATGSRRSRRSRAGARRPRAAWTRAGPRSTMPAAIPSTSPPPASMIPRRLIEQMRDGVPFLLLPVRIETKFFDDGSSRELRVRIFPDDIAITLHEKALTGLEAQAGRDYWKARALANGLPDAAQRPAARETAWTTMANRHGAYRAGWIAKVSQPANWSDTIADPAALQFAERRDEAGRLDGGAEVLRPAGPVRRPPLLRDAAPRGAGRGDPRRPRLRPGPAPVGSLRDARPRQRPPLHQRRPADGWWTSTAPSPSGWRCGSRWRLRGTRRRSSGSSSSASGPPPTSSRAAGSSSGSSRGIATGPG